MGHTTRWSTLIVALGLTGCAGSDKTLGVNERDPQVAQLVALGFRPDMIEDRGDYFLIEGDVRVSKDAIPRLTASRLPSTLDVLRAAESTPVWKPYLQWGTDVLVGQTQVQTILVDVSGLASQPAWQTAARDALVQWNAVNCSGVHLAEGTPADIVFSTTTSFPTTVAAIGSWPADAPAGSQKPGPTIQVNTPYTGTPNNASTKLRNMVHEIGHTIGFRHTNWQARGEQQTPPGANQISGTPQTDAASVMNGGTATEAWGGFSGYDRSATSTLYYSLANCVPAVSISGPQTVTLHQSAQYFSNASGGLTPYTYEWRTRQCSDTQGFSCGAWQNWFSTGSTNSTWASVNGCGIRRNELQSRVTTASGKQGYSSTYAVLISNPC